MSVSRIPGEYGEKASNLENVPPTLQRAIMRLDFPPSYVGVGIYRLCTDRALRVAAWDKCKHGARRGALVGFVWTCLTYPIQRRFVQLALTHPGSIFSFSYLTRLSAKASDISEETLLGYRLPFSISSYVAVLFLGAQVTTIIHFFLAKNIRVARQRAWDQTVASRGKGPDFWQPYVEEWEFPPMVNEKRWGRLDTIAKTWFWKLIVQKVVLLPLSLYPFVGNFIAAGFKALSTAEYLHTPYFKAKNMTPHQVAVFIEERKWDYRAFGFAAALLEGLPIVGLFFSVSNRIGAAMWAHDLEKRQHWIAEQRLHAQGANGADAEYVTTTDKKVD
ncbi:hypothetical protein CONPUDRAFT_116711 [Coniophora puteana RWD-64-598 SS2]|uniref:Uncharacterized protein n=1 Tax=Coniophora puteana (strain RWD-64-598) TaxID=741705 RepID=A0A5M3N7M9_CONPW|nr:uncharacterized protein CONPUDRAFT_116711 [Coniophora puteana RWD-64-598 SS2]EIW87449.1 hypothetical protein CONPUDRAFT_116711 [Coniophora puteana RWD-64-598 SS2]